MSEGYCGWRRIWACLTAKESVKVTVALPSVTEKTYKKSGPLPVPFSDIIA